MSIRANIVLLVAASTLMQCIALLGMLPTSAGTVGRQVFSTVEMLLVVLLAVQSWRIRRWSIRSAQAEPVQRIALLGFCSLLFCGLGDLVNRNYPDLYYQWDSIIRHGYLIQGIAFFFPGYLLIVIANREASRHRVSARYALATVAAALPCGLLAFLSDYRPDASVYASSAILLYTLLMSVLAVSSLWIIKAYGRTASLPFVAGVLLAPIADALIAKFWIYSDHFPVIEHVNWILYYSSLALIQQLPFLMAKSLARQPA